MIKTEAQPEPGVAYDARIAALVATHLGQENSNDRLTPLLMALGCRSLTFDSSDFVVRISPQPRANEETLVRKTLQLALERYCANQMGQYPADGFALLSGLCTGDRWLDCLSTVEGAYCLATLCLATCYENTIDPTLSQFDQEGFGLCAILNSWLRPAIPILTWPTAVNLAASLFGEPWYEFEVKFAGYTHWDMPMLVYRNRPAFSPGLLPLQSAAAALPLPNFDVYDQP